MATTTEWQAQRDADQAAAEAAAAQILALMAPLTDDAREILFGLLRDEFCEHCGREQPDLHPPCQCWNDE